MKKYISALIISILIAGCQQTTQLTEEEQNHNEVMDNNITISPDVAEEYGVIVQQVKLQPFYNVIKTSGQVTTTTNNEVIVVATAQGIIDFGNSVNVTEGNKVVAGSVIATVANNDLPSGDPNEKYKIEFETANENYKRAKQLAQKQIVPQKELELAKEKYELARVNYQAQANIAKNKGVNILAPITGIIKKRLAKQGEFVNVGQTVAVIANTNTLLLQADVPEKFFEALPRIKSATFRMVNEKYFRNTNDLNGKVIAYGKIATGSGYLSVVFQFDNTQATILPEAFAEVNLLTDTYENTITLPASAVMEEQNNFFVYRKVGDDDYKRQYVNVGNNNGEYVQILDGLHVGDSVVTNGAYHIKLAEQANVKTENHSH
jgi:RND family efflux transporter MFP subunit